MKRLPSEDVLVGRLQRLFATRRRDVLLGIGDDAAVVSSSGRLVVTTDALVEGSDFRKDADPHRLGRKALAVNLSDLAAMGASPLWALLALGLPRRTEPAWFDSFAEGFHEVAQEHGVAVVGGDLSAASAFFASVTVLGRAPVRGLLRRDGAKAGDLLYVSGTLGSAAAGFLLLEAGYRLRPDKTVRSPGRKGLLPTRATEVARLIRHQVDPRPKLDLGRLLAEGGIASAAIDLSDGLSRDLHRLCRASGLAATLEIESLPVDTGLRELGELVRLDPLRLALFGGEDYGLLFTVPKRKRALADRLAARFPIRPIGVMDGRGEPGTVRLRASSGERPLPDAGWDHFER
ncbi:MAG: thiamine-phosphate kinase [Thermoanaerobaculia bacterium]